MGSFVKPDLKIKSIYELNPEMLKNRGIKGLLFDIDNTLEEYATKVPGKQLIEFLKMLSDDGFKIGIVSNAKIHRAEAFKSGFPKESYPKIFVVGKAGKPLKKGFVEITGKMGINLNEAAMIGDQLFTDVLGANRAGCYSVLVDPINPKIEPCFVRFKRFLEKPFIWGDLCYI